ncbi:ComEA family DNA-binding protein [Trujillonella humicola]|uniref:ComEA family DNA-binding protein n=1 Tax=Trujillonella humicola TaxID=3383699 RepID=UPI0039057F57
MTQSGGPAPSTSERFLRGGWYYVVAVGTVGLFAAAPFWHAWHRLRRPPVLRSAVLYTALGAALVALTSLIPRDASGEPVGSGAAAVNGVLAVSAVAVVVAACLQLRPLRREVYGRPGELPSHSDRVLAGALAARARREEARELAGRDPALARDLGIGRPDLGRGYDDGGLVDVNTAPAAVIEQVCTIDRSHAAAIVAARERRGSFYNVGELLVDVDLPPHVAAHLQERGIAL